MCILFRLFVAVCVGQGIYNFYKWIKDKIEDKIIDINWKATKKEQAEKERLSQMTEEQIKEEKEISWEIKFTLLIVWVIIILGVLIYIVKNY